MGRRNQERRAAKQRARRRRGPTPPRADHNEVPGETWESFAPPPPDPEMVAEMLLEAAAAYGRGGASGPAECARQLCRGQHGSQPGSVSTAADIALQHVVSQLWQKGWLPVDLWHVVRRRLGAQPAGLIVDVITANLAQYAPAQVPDRWHAQLAEVDGSLWWDRDRPHLDQWASSTGTDGEQALVTVVTLLAQLMTLPKLPLTAPLPGTTGRRSATTHGIDSKVLTRVRALLAKAEVTDYPEEAEALSGKAQELMDRHAFERALLDEQEDRPQSASSSRFWPDAPYIDAKANLVHVLAQANRCRAVYHSDYGFVSLVGDTLDLEIVELLATSLLVQATSAMLAEGKQESYTGTSRTRSFRRSFLIAYANRIGERLAEAGAAARAAADDSRLAPVLADRSRAVDDEFERLFSDTVKKSVSVSNASGWRAGRAAADRADIGVERTTLPA